MIETIHQATSNKKLRDLEQVENYILDHQIPDMPSNLLESIRASKKQLVSTCKYCLKAQRHAQLHGQPPDYVLCTPHRKLQSRYVLNSANVGDRNPSSLHEHPRILSADYVPQIGKRIPIFWGINVCIDSFFFFYPVVSAEIENGEYVKRRFQTFFTILQGEKWNWGILDDAFLHEQIGIANLTQSIDTCVWGDAKNEDYIEPLSYIQRDSCNHCLYLPKWLFMEKHPWLLVECFFEYEFDKWIPHWTSTEFDYIQVSETNPRNHPILIMKDHQVIKDFSSCYWNMSNKPVVYHEGQKPIQRVKILPNPNQTKISDFFYN